MVCTTPSVNSRPQRQLLCVYKGVKQRSRKRFVYEESAGEHHLIPLKRHCVFLRPKLAETRQKKGLTRAAFLTDQSCKRISPIATRQQKLLVY